MTKRDEVLRFIDRFTGNGKHQEVISCFTSGCCYWFAHILEQRFADQNPKILYDPIINHYACQIGFYIFDITGDITYDEKYCWHNWDLFKFVDNSLTLRLYRDCINFGGPEEEENKNA